MFVTGSMAPTLTFPTPFPTYMEDRVAEFTVRVMLPEILPEVAVIVAVPAELVVTRPPPVIVATD
jgi:hypothetical protein